MFDYLAIIFQIYEMVTKKKITDDAPIFCEFVLCETDEEIEVDEDNDRIEDG